MKHIVGSCQCYLLTTRSAVLRFASRTGSIVYVRFKISALTVPDTTNMEYSPRILHPMLPRIHGIFIEKHASYNLGWYSCSASGTRHLARSGASFARQVKASNDGESLALKFKRIFLR